MDAKGCFQVSICKSNTTILGKSLILKFHIVQHCRNIELIKKLNHILQYGRIELSLEQSTVYFVVTKFNDIYIYI